MSDKLHTTKGDGGAYFASPKSSMSFIPSGCRLVDMALGGGWAEGRIANIIGDQSTGKTLLAIEACANFAKKYPKGIIRYREAEAAFDKLYAQALGMPIDRIDFGDHLLDTVEDMYDDINRCLEKAKHPQLYILDSLDALSDKDEMERDFSKDTYGAKKAKMLSQFFRRMVRPIEQKNMTVIIINQTRDKIGVKFGEKKGRTGGRALDFYASQVIMLAKLKTLSQTIHRVKRPIGIQVRMRVKKNKVGLPFREASFPLIFGYGIDDVEAAMDWLDEIRVSFPKKATDAEIMQLVEKNWYRIEKSFLPTKTKYGG